MGGKKKKKKRGTPGRGEVIFNRRFCAFLTGWRIQKVTSEFSTLINYTSIILALYWGKYLVHQGQEEFAPGSSECIAKKKKKKNANRNF